MVTASQASEPDYREMNHLGTSTIFLLLASWGMFLSAWINYLPSVAEFFSNYPAFVAVLSLGLPAGFASFGIAASWFYGVIIYKCWVCRGEIPVARMLLLSETLRYIFDTLSIAVKLLVVFIIIGSDQFGPTAGCISMDAPFLDPVR
jgi:hypothetical protein